MSHPNTVSGIRPQPQRIERTCYPLSPRQKFQSYVRTLSDEDVPQVIPQSNPKTRRELRHLNTSPVQSQDASNLPRENIAYRGSTFSLVSSPRLGLQNEENETDLFSAEREAWARRSPGRISKTPFTISHWRTQSEPPLEFEEELYKLDPPEEQNSPILQPQKQASPLRQFEPLDAQSVTSDRPKTRRGPSSFISEPGLLCSSSETTDEEDLRKSKFMEGSMNERSIAVASTWNDQNTELSYLSQSTDDSDSEATPKVSRVSSVHMDPKVRAQGNSFTRMFKLGSNRRAEDGTKTTKDTPHTSRKKGLRKSISTWNFHSLSEKMKTFGTSSQDLTSTKEADINEKAILDDRKRKAQEAYIQQFGLKKQKSNAGLAISLDNSKPTRSGHNVISPRKTSSFAQENTKSTLPTFNGRYSLSGIVPQHGRPVEVVETSKIDLRKRPSRRELEKENQQLRTLLQESEKRNSNLDYGFHRSASQSRLHLPLNVTNCSENPMPYQDKATRKDKIPHLSSLPTRKALGVVSNLQNHAYNAPPAGKTSDNTSRPVSIILEEDENEETHHQKVGSASRSPVKVVREEWEWPDDVF